MVDTKATRIASKSRKDFILPRSTKSIRFLLIVVSVSIIQGCGSGDVSSTNGSQPPENPYAPKTNAKKTKTPEMTYRSSNAGGKSALEIEAEVTFRRRKSEYERSLPEWNKKAPQLKQMQAEIERLSKQIESQAPETTAEITLERNSREIEYITLLSSKPVVPSLEKILEELKDRELRLRGEPVSWEQMRKEVVEGRKKPPIKINTNNKPKFKTLIGCALYLQEYEPVLFEKALDARNRWQDAAFAGDLSTLKSTYQELCFLLEDNYLLFYWDVDDIMRDERKIQKLLQESREYRENRRRRGM